MLCFVVIWLLACVCYVLSFALSVFFAYMDRKVYFIRLLNKKPNEIHFTIHERKKKPNKKPEVLMLSFVTNVVCYCVVMDMLNLTRSGERSDPCHRHLSWHPGSNHRRQDGARRVDEVGRSLTF